MADDVPVGPFRDATLSAVVSAVDTGLIEQILVTFLVGGTWIAGVAVGGRRWHEQLAAEFDESQNETLAEVLRAIGAEAYPSDSEAQVTGKEQDLGLPEFVHLVDARVFVPGSNPPAAGVTIRVRLDAVQAYIPGWATSLMN